MGIQVVVETNVGDRLCSIEDPTNILHRMLPVADDQRFSCLNRVDWYGDTVFNRLQASDVRRELSLLIEQAPSPSERDLLVRILGAVDLAEAEPHRYLKFLGD